MLFDFDNYNSLIVLTIIALDLSQKYIYVLYERKIYLFYKILLDDFYSISIKLTSCNYDSYTFNKIIYNFYRSQKYIKSCTFIKIPFSYDVSLFVII